MKKQLIILAVLATIINSLAGCAGTDWRAVRRDAGAILGKVAVAQLRTLVAGNLGSDYGHAAAQAHGARWTWPTSASLSAAQRGTPQPHAPWKPSRRRLWRRAA